MEEDLDRLGVCRRESKSVSVEPASSTGTVHRRLAKGSTGREKARLDAPAVMTMNSQMPRLRVCKRKERVRSVLRADLSPVQGKRERTLVASLAPFLSCNHRAPWATQVSSRSLEQSSGQSWAHLLVVRGLWEGRGGSARRGRGEGRERCAHLLHEVQDLVREGGVGERESLGVRLSLHEGEGGETRTGQARAREMRTAGGEGEACGQRAGTADAPL